MEGLSKWFNDWIKRPFKPEGNVVDWALFLGLAIVIAVAWMNVLKHIEE